MRINSKGQVTIPAAIRLLPGTEVECELEGMTVLLSRPSPDGGRGRGACIVAHLRRHGGDIQMSTDEIMALTRGR